MIMLDINDLANFICVISSFSANVDLAVVTSQLDTFMMNLLNKFYTCLLVSSKIVQRFVCSLLNTSHAFSDALNLKVSNAELCGALEWYWFVVRFSSFACSLFERVALLPTLLPLIEVPMEAMLCIP